MAVGRVLSTNERGSSLALAHRHLAARWRGVAVGQAVVESGSDVHWITPFRIPCHDNAVYKVCVVHAHVADGTVQITKSSKRLGEVSTTTPQLLQTPTPCPTTGYSLEYTTPTFPVVLLPKPYTFNSRATKQTTLDPRLCEPPPHPNRNRQHRSSRTRNRPESVAVSRTPHCKCCSAWLMLRLQHISSCC